MKIYTAFSLLLFAVNARAELLSFPNVIVSKAVATDRTTQEDLPLSTKVIRDPLTQKLRIVTDEELALLPPSTELIPLTPGHRYQLSGDNQTIIVVKTFELESGAGEYHAR